MNIIHSIWTKPMLKERWNVTNQIEKNLWLFGYSVDYVNRIGQSIDLHTDDFGATVFDILPYRNIHVTLNELEDLNERFWSAGKIVAIRESELGTLHIDGDVFLKKESIIPMLDIKGFDCIVQMQERHKIFMDSYADVLPMFRNADIKAHGFDYKLESALNAGILGFNNQKLKDDFVKGFFEMIEQCTNNQEFMSLLKYDLDKKIEPNVVLEQYYLKGLCQTDGYSIKNLLEVKSENFDDDVADVNRQADEKGFTHCWGNSKWLVIEQIKDILAERNPELFQAITDKVIEINNI